MFLGGGFLVGHSTSAISTSAKWPESKLAELEFTFPARVGWPVEADPNRANVPVCSVRQEEGSHPCWLLVVVLDTSSRKVTYMATKPYDRFAFRKRDSEPPPSLRDPSTSQVSSVAENSMKKAVFITQTFTR